MKPKFNRKPVRSVLWCLRSIGVIIHQKKISARDFHQYIAIYPFLHAFVSITLYVLMNLKNISDAVIAAAYLGGCVVMFSSLMIFTRNRRKIHELLEIIDRNVYTYPDENDTDVVTREIFKDENCIKFLLLVMAYECFGFSLADISPLFAFILTGVYEVMVFPAWYPWNIEGILSVILTTCLQLAGCVAAFWITYVMQVVVACITVEFIRQYQRLCAALRSIQYRSTISASQSRKDYSYLKSSGVDANVDRKFKRRYNSVYRENILHCVKHHQQLWKLFRLFEPWFSLYYSIELAMSAVVFALAFYNLLVNWSPSMFLTILGSTFNVLANLFSRCIVGEIFAEMNVKLTNIIFYEINWWEQSGENRNLLLFFHLITKRSYELKAYSVYAASYYTFSRIIRMSYSYFNIIRSTLST